MKPCRLGAGGDTTFASGFARIFAKKPLFLALHGGDARMDVQSRLIHRNL
jgi:hypothetical protein